jgi:hypothetical protein
MPRLSRGRGPRDPGNIVFGTFGWLFADLMFALAIAFLVATTVGQPPRPVALRPTPSPSASPTPSPSATPSPSPSSTQEPVLELMPVEMTLPVDWVGLLNGNRSASDGLQRQIRGDQRLFGRRAGLVLTFGGAQGVSYATAINIANRADDAMTALGATGFVFQGTVYRPFLGLNAPPGTLVVDIYLFKL